MLYIARQSEIERLSERIRVLKYRLPRSRGHEEFREISRLIKAMNLARDHLEFLDLHQDQHYV